MGAGVKLLIGGPALLYVAAFGVASVLLEIFMRYSRYVSVLKWLSLSLLAYAATAFIVDVPWSTVALHTFVPHIVWKTDYFVTVVAVFGTTISPYLFFWQAETEVEDQQERPGAEPLTDAPEQAREEIRRIEIDTYFGMGISNLVALFIVVTTAATLNVHGITDIQTSADAAKALRPLAGDFAFVIFAAGIIGTGLLALPVLAGSAAYALGEALAWPVGLARQWYQARAFYATDRRRHRARRGDELPAHRSDEGAVLERGDQWRRRRSDHGDDDADRHAAEGHGPLHPAAGAALAGLDRHGGDGASQPWR